MCISKSRAYDGWDYHALADLHCVGSYTRHARTNGISHTACSVHRGETYRFLVGSVDMLRHFGIVVVVGSDNHRVLCHGLDLDDFLGLDLEIRHDLVHHVVSGMVEQMDWQWVRTVCPGLAV